MLSSKHLLFLVCTCDTSWKQMNLISCLCVCVTENLEVGGHFLVAHTFNSFTWCDKCGKFLWGLRKQGVKCKGM